MAFFVTPVTILTGFLGAGKTTLVNRFLKEAHGKRFVVIENEFGEVSIDDDLVYHDAVETVVQLANGCLCCRVRGDLARALGELATRRDVGELHFDHVLIETSGVADPGPIIQTFLAETAILTRYALDGVVTLVDAANIQKILGETNEAVAQIALADRILLTKTDRLDSLTRVGAERAVRELNSMAQLGAVDLVNAGWGEIFSGLLDIRGYEFNRVVFDGSFALATPKAKSGFAATPIHTSGVSAIAYRTGSPLEARRIQEAFATIRNKFGDRIWRMKGILAVANYPKRIVVQGVQDFLQVNDGLVWRPCETRETKLVVIGARLDREFILSTFEACELSDLSTLSSCALEPLPRRKLGSRRQ
jgi:G3E family GTPase